MLKRSITLLFAALWLAVPALAEVYQGETEALSRVAVIAETEGTVSGTACAEGQCVPDGQTICTLRPEKVFSETDGTVSIVYAGVGDSVSGTVLEILPEEKYTVYCTVDKAYDSAAAKLVHSGETVYLRCTKDGSHRGVGIVTQIDGKEYTVLTIGGEFYVGETVYLFRSADFAAAGRIGIGTVTVTDTLVYEAKGELTRLRVAEGDSVERGQLLYETGGGDIASPAGGIVTSLSVRSGDAVSEGQTIAEIVPFDEVCAVIRVDEKAAAAIAPGDGAVLAFGGREDETVLGTVIDVSRIPESGTYAVRIRPDDTGRVIPLGMSVTAWL